MTSANDAPPDKNGNVTFMAQGAKQNFRLFTTKLMLQTWFPVNNKVQTTFTPILIPNKNTLELKNNVNPMSKKLKFSRVLDFLCSDKKILEKWEKNKPS